MNAWQLIKARFISGEKLHYTVPPRKELPENKKRNPPDKVLRQPKPKTKPVVFGSRSNGSYTKRDNEEPKYRRKLRQASQRRNRRH
jgi:hypothetical protein